MVLTELNPGTKLELEVYNELDEKIIPTFVSELEWIDKENMAFIAAPIYEGVIYPVRVGAKMNVYFNVNFDLYKFKAKVIDRKNHDNIALLKIEADGELIKIQRRQFFRFDCSVPVEYRIISSLNPEQNEKIPFEKSITKDLSGGGICILVIEKVELEALVECKLKLGETNAVGFFGRVVRVTKLENEGKYKYEIGVLMKKVENRIREAVIKFIFEEQRRLRKKGLI